MKDTKALKTNLEKLYTKYNKRSLIPPDPLQFVYQYDNPLDKEIVALLSSALAYGNVRQIQISLTKLFACLDPSPHDFVCNFTNAERKKLKNFKHRFNTGNDIADLLTLLKTIYKKKYNLPWQTTLKLIFGHNHIISPGVYEEEQPVLLSHLPDSS